MWTDALPREGPLLLMLDFDGTLAPIVAHPHDARVVEDVPALLSRLEERGHAVWVISGRRADDVRARLGAGVPVIGLHGLDGPGGVTLRRHPRLDDAAAAARRAIDDDAALYGAHVEDKGLTVALHYRGAADQERAARLLGELVERAREGDPSLSVIHGHCVVELRPVEASKAHAVRRLVERHAGYFPVYVGDDITDEEAFVVLEGRGLAVRVAATEVQTRAHVVARDVDEVVRGLRELAQIP